MSKKDVPKNMGLDEFLAGATEAHQFKQITLKIIEKENKALSSGEGNKRDQDWAVLANQVVGSENF